MPCPNHPPLPCPCRCPCPAQSTANLATTIIGAGIMALPRTFATLGIVLGVGMMALVYGLSYFSLFALVRCALRPPQRRRPCRGHSVHMRCL